jgi:hypothetical protein
MTGLEERASGTVNAHASDPSPKRSNMRDGLGENRIRYLLLC